MIVESFIESPRLELPRGWSYEVETLYDVDVIPRGHGAEQRNLKSSYGRTRISVTVPRDRVSDIPYIYRFHRVMRGRAVGFRVQDPSDYLSTEQGYISSAEDPAPSATDQPLIAVPGTSTQYQLYKQYVLGDETIALIEERIIVKPVASTIRVANQDGVEQSPDRWSLDPTTGILTPGMTFEGTPTTWGGQFDIAVRFDSELPRRVEDFRLDETSFVLLELPP
jgi:uncharacterized protein (TIGR02217 family)